MERVTINGDETTALAPIGETRLIACGWCGQPTEADADCQHCNHEEPTKPWVQRNQKPPQAKADREAGRPALDHSQIAQRVRIARKELGPDVTNAALAAHLGISERTLQRWQKVSV